MSIKTRKIKLIAVGETAKDRTKVYNHLKNDASSFNTLKTMFGKSLAVNKNLPQGHLIAISDLESKKPGDQGIPAKEFQRVIGKQLKHDLKQWNFLGEEDLL